MRIPVYKPNVAYRSAQAQMVPLARAQKQAVGHTRWAVLKTAGEMIADGVETAQAVGKWFKKSSVPESKTADTKATAFTSGKRGELLQFCKEQAFAPQDERETAQSPLERLDEFFSAQNAPDMEPNDLLAQDYAVLRRELEKVTLRQARAEREEAFTQGMAHLLQTAALIAEPKALDSYLQSNFSAIQAEKILVGSAEERQAQKQALLGQCIGHNVRAALQAGETEQAEKVYRHFAARLPAQEQTHLQTAISTARAEEQAQKIAPLLYPSMRESGEIDKTLIHQTAVSTAPSEEAQALLERALTAGITRQLRQEFARRAEGAAALYGAARARESGPLPLLSAALPPSVGQRYGKAFSGFSSLKTKRDETAFNQTYGKILDGEISSADINKQFDQGQISGEEFLLLENAVCRQKAGLSGLEEKALFTALNNWCAQKGLNPREAESLKYAVFTAGNDTQTRLNAARKMQQIFQLQELQS